MNTPNHTRMTFALALWISGCSSSSIGLEVESTRQPIVNGASSSIAQVVPVTYTTANGSSGQCSGVVIDDTAVLTAAHCVGQRTLSADGVPNCNYRLPNCPAAPDGRPLCTPDGCPLFVFMLYSGLQVKVGGSMLAPSHITRHPKEVDIAILHLPTAVSVAPLPLSYVDPKVGDEMLLVGFGATAAGAPTTAGTRREARAKIGGVNEERTISFVLEPGYGATCIGDSGGPALVDEPGAGRKVIGLNIRGPTNCQGDGTLANPFVALGLWRYQTWLSREVPGIAPPATKLGPMYDQAQLFARQGEASLPSDPCLGASGCWLPGAEDVITSNVGAGELGPLTRQVTYHDGSGWLSFSERRMDPHSGGLTHAVMAHHRGNAAGLTPGVYRATVKVSETYSTTSPDYPVALFVIPPGGAELFDQSATTVLKVAAGNRISAKVAIAATYAGGAPLLYDDLWPNGEEYPVGYAGPDWLSSSRGPNGEILLRGSSSSTMAQGVYTAKAKFHPRSVHPTRPQYSPSGIDLFLEANVRLEVVESICGDSYVDGAEVCDDGNAVTETTCPYGGTWCTACDASCRQRVTIDLLPPPAPRVTAPAPGTTTRDPTPTFAGTAERGSTVTISVDGSVVGTATTNNSGAWSYVPTAGQALGDGSHVVSATARDAAGNTSVPSATHTFTVNTAGPITPTVTSPTVTSPGHGSVIADTTPTVSGMAEPGSTVDILIDGTVVGGTPTMDAAGNWTYTLTAALAEGSHAVRAAATDGQGNTSPWGATNTFTVDTAAPAAPTVSSPAASSATTATTPTVTGTAEPGTVIAVTVDGTVVGTGTADAAGLWRVTVDPGQPLAEGNHTVSATATDAAGNTSPASAGVGFTVDTTPPPPPEVTSPTEDSAINDSTPTVNGTAEAGATVTVAVEGVVVETATADGSGSWSCTLAPGQALGDGRYTITATATDAAGNNSVSRPIGFSVDATVPAAPAISSPTPNAAVSDFPTVGGTAEANATVTVFVDGVAGGGTVADGAGGWTFTPTAPLTVGGHALTATATDAAGNTSPASAAVAVTVLVAPNGSSGGGVGTGTGGGVGTGTGGGAGTGSGGGCSSGAGDAGTPLVLVAMLGLVLRRARHLGKRRQQRRVEWVEPA